MINLKRQKYQELDKLAKDTRALVFSDSAEYQKFLDSSAWTYKYPVEDQILIYAQRPNTKAVASMQIWNGTVKRWINSGSKGIGLLRCKEEQGYTIDYVFAVEDTHSKNQQDQFVLWQMNESYQQTVEEVLKREFALEDAFPMQASIWAASWKLIEKSQWNDESKRFITNSVQYIVQSRCGMDTAHIDISIPKTVNQNCFEKLLNAISSTAQKILRCIENTVRREKRRDNHENHLSRRGRGNATELYSAGRSVGAGQIWDSTHAVAEGERQLGNIQVTDRREIEPIFYGSRQNSTGESGYAGGGFEKEESWAGESDRSDGLGTAHQLSNQSSGGNRETAIPVRDTAISGRVKKKSEQPNEYQQLSFEAATMEKAEDESERVSSAFSFTQDEIDHVLRLGGNTDRQRERIIAEFAKQKPLNELAKILPTFYQGGNGFVGDRGSVTAWYAPEGIKLSRRTSVRYNQSAHTVPWETVAERINQLLEEGRFATNVELIEADDYERLRLAQQMWFLYHDFSDNAKTSGYLKSLSNIQGNGFEDETRWLSNELLKEGFRSVLLEEYNQFLADFKENTELLRFKYHKLEGIKLSLLELDLPRRTFEGNMQEIPKVKQFITEDELEVALARGSGFSEGKKRIFKFFSELHTAKEKVEFLKNEYGVGGHSHALSGATGSDESHDSRGIKYQKNNCPIVTLTWENVSKRISELIVKGRYSDEQQSPDYHTSNYSDELEQQEKLIGRIHFTSGEQIEFTDVNQFLETIKEELPYMNTTGFRYEILTDDAAVKKSVSDIVLDFSGENESELMDEVEKRNDSPVWDYGKIKEQNSDRIVLYQVGDFFEIYGQDAEKVASALEISLDTQAIPDMGNVQMCMIPENQLNLYMTMLLDRGYDLAIAEGDDFEEKRVYSINSVYKNKPIESRPIGRIEYIGANGKESASIEYTDAEKFEKDIREESDYGVPISVYVYKDKDGHSVPHSFIFELDPPPRQFEVIDSPLLVNHKPGQINITPSNIEESIKLWEQQARENATIVDDTSEERHQTISRNAQNFRITDNQLGEGGAKAKFQANIDAILLLKELERTGQQASSEQQEVLSKYVGWGGLSDAFDPEKEAWNKEYKQLKEILTAEEYNVARGSTLNAHYTSPTIIRAMYNILGKIGFESGNILEPSCGVGNFFGMLPENMTGSKLYGVELDSISGRIAKQLYPKADITVAGFETTERRSFYDLAVGNVPFGQYQVNDKAYNKLGFNIHNYFFAKALDQVRPGGVVAFITSRYTMDSKDSKVRRYISQRAELIGAIRLPNNAFKANAGTEVVSDIIFLKKREYAQEMESEWVNLGQTKDGFSINQYFIDHPEMILGENASHSTAHGMDYTVNPIAGIPLEQLLEQAMQQIPAGVYIPYESQEEEEVKTIPANPEVKDYSFAILNDKVYYRENSIMRLCLYDKTSSGEMSMTEKRIRGLVGLREEVRKLIDLQVDGCSDDELIQQQKKLESCYDSFTKTYGLVNSDSNRRAFSLDVDYPLIATLEEVEGRGSEMRLKSKSAMFTQRTIRRSEVIEHCNTAVEALNVSLGETGNVDLLYMSQLTGESEESLIKGLTGIIWLDPQSRKWMTSNEYLSGDIQAKLRMAQNAAQSEPELFSQNIEALQKAMPERLEAPDISVRLGATWIEPQYIQQFAYETFGTQPYLKDRIQVKYSKQTGNWFIQGKTQIFASDTKATVTYGTKRLNAYELLEQSLNLRPAKVVDYIREEDGTVKAIPNPQQTTIAQQKQELIERTFKDWIFADSQRREYLVNLYNERFNTIRPCQYDGTHLTFDGMNPLIELKPHQKNAVAHVLYGKNTLLFHCVGAGKTYEMIASAMESKRLGLLSKPMFVVPNHLTADFGSEFRKLYPQAKVLVTRKEDFEKQNRRRFLAKIAMGEWDGVVIGHSQFSMLPVSLELQTKFIQKQLNDLEEALEALNREKNEDKFSVKQIERSKKALQTRLEKLITGQRKDDMLRFEQLGIDKLYVDEADEFKNLMFVSKMEGMGSVDSQKAMDLYLKCRYMDEKTEGKGIVFATGTPIANSIAEMYTMQRYLQSDLLDSKGLSMFDSWASTFAESVTEMELKPEGTGYRMKTRLAKFYNVPELMSMFCECADIVTADMVNLPRPEAIYENIVIKPSQWQKQMVQDLAERAEAIRAREVEPTQDNMLRVTNDGRSLALDQRLINPSLPYEQDGKIAVCAKNIASIWNETTPSKGTQIVFCDLATPGGKKDGFSAYDELKRLLIEQGVPDNEIAYIHSANTDQRKQELYDKVRRGDVRVLIGSTGKMGAGTNVQTRLAALHHLDVPWRPRDIEQREGRIIRQGNQNKQVKIFRYVTEGTFDSYSWQLIEKKQRFISQVVTNRSAARVCEDLEGAALSYAEVKALAAGNPEIKERMDLEISVTKLRTLKKEYQTERYRLEDNLQRSFPAQVMEVKETISKMKKDLHLLADVNQEQEFEITIGEKVFDSRKDATNALAIALKETTPESYQVIGRYLGFEVSAKADAWNAGGYFLKAEANYGYCFTSGDSVAGIITRLENQIRKIPELLQSNENELARLETEIANAKMELEKQWPMEEELRVKECRLSALNAKLSSASSITNTPSNEEEHEFEY